MLFAILLLEVIGNRKKLEKFASVNGPGPKYSLGQFCCRNNESLVPQVVLIEPTFQFIVAKGPFTPNERKRLHFSAYFNVESVCIHHWCQWVTQTVSVNGP